MRRAFVIGVITLAIGCGVAQAGGPAAPLPLPCGLPETAPLWVDYADGQVPFWSTVFARPGVVAAASQLLVPPQLRAKGAQTVYFDLYLNKRVGTPSQPNGPADVDARADRLFDAAVASSGCDHPLIAENELFGSQTPTPWTATTAQYRANVLAFLTRLAARGARPFLLLSTRPYTHDVVADEWWRQVAQVADLVPEIYFSGPSVSAQGAVVGSRRLRATMRTRIEDLIQIGVPTNRLGMMLTFSSTPGAGGREGLELAKWLDVVKWESLAAQQVSAELRIASVWSWGWATFSAAGDDPEKPLAACTWLWTRDHSLCVPPKELDRSLDVGAVLPAGTLCVLGRARLLADDVAALSRLTGDRELAFSAGYQHAVLLTSHVVTGADVRRAEVEVILDHFAGSRPAYDAALARAKATHALARVVLADELRRLAVQRTLRVAAPTAAQVRRWFDVHASTRARLTSRGLVLAPADRVFALAAGETATIDGQRLTALGEVAPLATFPLTRAAPTIRLALLGEAKKAAFAEWLDRRENQSLGSLACRHDRAPQPATIDLTNWLPFLSLG